MEDRLHRKLVTDHEVGSELVQSLIKSIKKGSVMDFIELNIGSMHGCEGRVGRFIHLLVELFQNIFRNDCF